MVQGSAWGPPGGSRSGREDSSLGSWPPDRPLGSARRAPSLLPQQPYALAAFIAPLAHRHGGARGSFGWFDRGALDKRSAKAVEVHARSGAPESAGGGLSVKV